MIGRLCSAVIVAFLLILPMAMPQPAGATETAPFLLIVNTTIDAVDSNPGDGSCATAGGQCSLRAAIMEANTGSGARSVNVPSGTFRLTLAGRNEDGGRSGDLDVRRDLYIRGASSGATIVDGAKLDRVFDIHPGITAALSNMTIKGGSIGPGDLLAASGGGIRTLSALTLVATVVTDNVASYGGGIYTRDVTGVIASTISRNRAIDGAGMWAHTMDARLAIETTTFRENVASGRGGGLLFEGAPALLGDLTVRSNQARDGAGIFIAGALTVAKSTIADNRAIYKGGGIAVSNGYLSSRDLSLTGNQAGGWPQGGVGGGLSISPGATATINDSLISRNKAINGNGGGLANGGTVTLERVTLSENAATTTSRSGGGLANEGTANLTNVTLSRNMAWIGGGLSNLNAGTAALRHVTITGNMASDRGGGIAQGSTGPVKLGNSIISASSKGNCVGPIQSAGHNLEDAATCSLSLSTGDLINVAPRLGPLASNDGLTPTHALLAGSPAIDAGSPTLCAATDQRDVTRPQDGNRDGIPACDIGAFEVVQ